MNTPAMKHWQRHLPLFFAVALAACSETKLEGTGQKRAADATPVGKGTTSTTGGAATGNGGGTTSGSTTGTGTGGTGTGMPEPHIPVKEPVGARVPVAELVGGAKPISGSSKDPKIASFDDKTGEIVGIATGETTITVVLPNGQLRTFDVTITPGEVKPLEGLTDEGGVKVGRPDLNACATLPDKGKQNYGAVPRCPDNAVVVIVNDGKAPELTCCPLPGKDLLSKLAAEQYQPRTGMCGDGEVATGMTSPEGPALLCTKLDPRLKIDAKVPAQYALAANPSPTLAAIAAGYHLLDCCICPEGTVILGGHTSQDNVCADQCGKIVAK